MPSLDKPEPPPPASIQWRIPPVHPDGRRFLVAAAALALFCWWVIDWDTLGWFVAFIGLGIAAFFRDPVRTTPLGNGLIVSPADGTVTMISTVVPPRELLEGGALEPEPVVRISIYMSIFDAHIIRSPIEGTVKKLVYVAGKTVNTDLDKGSEDNERQHLLIEGTDGTRIAFTQIAGLIGRRIVCWVEEGGKVVPGQRVGIIRFGSRTDVYLPAGTGSQALLGQRTIAGETILARTGVSELLEGVAQ
jgi:phosphatidylserine decarboxylase